ncbi:MAG: MerR family transcriptional regulator [Clostridia bacterium]|nr:MerR family transcriptional regulator [Clostridia bacterium]
MTIYELEKRSGVSRPNIRFYEKEGLLAPKRLPNGYRDYGEEEVGLLARIVLLRRLDMPLDAIRAVIGGQLPLALALEHQQAMLAQKQEETQQARQLCTAIQADGVSFGQLEPERYRAQLPMRADGRLLPPGQPGWEPANGHWIMRFIAFVVDLTGLSLIWEGFQLYLLRMPELEGFFWNAAHYAFLTVGFVVYESVMLWCCGATVGKQLMGLRVMAAGENGPGELTVGSAFRRTLCKLVFGLGLRLPVLSWAAYLLAVRRAKSGRAQPWDESCDYTVKDRGERSGWAFMTLLLMAAMVAGTVCMRMDAMNPPHTNDSASHSVRAFTENVNDLIQFHTDYDLRFHEDGTWSGAMAGMDLSAFTVTFEEGDHRQISRITMRYPLPAEYPSKGMVNDGVELKKLVLCAMFSDGTLDGYFDAERLSYLVRGEGQAAWNGWVMHQAVEGAPENFAEYYEYIGYLDGCAWKWIGPPDGKLSETPEVVFVMENYDSGW